MEPLRWLICTSWILLSLVLTYSIFLHHEAGSANFCLTIFESLSGKAMFCSERRVPFDGEYWWGMYEVVFVKVRATCKKKHITYQVSFNSLSGRNWWAHKGRVWDKTGTELWSVSWHSEAFRQGDNLWKDWWFFCCQDHWVWRLNIRYPLPMLLVHVMHGRLPPVFLTYLTKDN